MTQRAHAREGVEVTGGFGDPPEDPPARACAGTGGPSLVRLIAHLTRRSHRTLLALSETTGVGKTDVVNRAIQIFTLVDELVERGGGHLTVIHHDGRRARIDIL